MLLRDLETPPFHFHDLCLTVVALDHMYVLRFRRIQVSSLAFNAIVFHRHLLV